MALTKAHLLAFLAACAASSGLPRARFANAPIVRVVNDRADVPALPDTYVHYQDLDFFDSSVQRPVERVLELPRDLRALGTNALDEVPDSTWFTNRIGVRPLDPEEIENGPLTSDSLEQHKPWTITSTKIGGRSLGYVLRDARGIK